MTLREILYEEGEMYDTKYLKSTFEKKFKANPVAYFEKTGWTIPVEKRNDIIIYLADLIKQERREWRTLPETKLVGKILKKLAQKDDGLKAILDGNPALAEECERDKKRKNAIELKNTTQTNASKLKKALAVLCMVWAVQGLAPATPAKQNTQVKTPPAVVQMEEKDLDERKQTC